MKRFRAGKPQQSGRNFLVSGRRSLRFTGRVSTWAHLFINHHIYKQFSLFSVKTIFSKFFLPKAAWAVRMKFRWEARRLGPWKCDPPVKMCQSRFDPRNGKFVISSLSSLVASFAYSWINSFISFGADLFLGFWTNGYQSIAFETLYNFVFECVEIWWSGGPQIHENVGSQRHLLASRRLCGSFASKRFTQSKWTQKVIYRADQGLSIGMQVNKIPLNPIELT